MAKLLNILLQRSDESIPWGFRLQGGADYKKPLTVQRVTPGTLASQHLAPGDTILMIEGHDARTLCHFDACDLVKAAGNKVELTVRKSQGAEEATPALTLAKLP
ncbi:PDZ and LIM domain protein 3-like [Penaeus chinensis]|uniref:PDZ and LIM domain protein 3-like n=1 Tax=Penaeus chinensis TaxID=139456 RepID=UPI001FB75C2A|nr:PDZ and LIM domain protein 3-like [Penaeus chinensis]